MLKIYWNENLCCHAGVCVSSLPEVFRVENGRLQIDPTAADDQTIQDVVVQCPSGALHAEESD